MTNQKFDPREALERAKLADAVYKNNKVNSIVANKWKVIHTSNSIEIQNENGKAENLSQWGYYAEAYQNIETGEIKIVNRGTQASFYSFFNGDLAKDGFADIQLSLNQIPNQLEYAIKFTQKVSEMVKVDPSKIEQIGHSLGGYLANTVAMMVGAKGFGINSPGFAEILRKIAISAKDLYKNYKNNLTPEQIQKNAENITTLNTTGDKISDVNEQLGKVIEIPVSDSGASFLGAYFSNMFGAAPIVSATIMIGSHYLLEEHSVSAVVNKLEAIINDVNDINSNDIDPNLLEGYVFRAKFADGTKKQIFFAKKETVELIESKYGIKIEESDFLATKEDSEYLLVESDRKYEIDGEKKTLTEIINNEKRQEQTLLDYAASTSEAISSVIMEVYEKPGLIDEMKGEFLGRIIIGDSIEEIANDLAAKFAANIIVEMGEDWVEKSFNVNFDKTEEATKFLAGSLKAGLISFGTAIATKASQGDTIHGEEYAEAAIVATTQAAANRIDFVNFGFKGSPPTDSAGNALPNEGGSAGVNAGIAAAVVSIASSLAQEASMNSEEYENAAKQALVAGTIAAVTAIAVTAIISALTLGAGTPLGIAVGSALGIIIGTVLSKFGGVALYNLFDSTWDNTEEVYDVYEDLYLKGELFSDELGENVKQMLKAIEDQLKAMTIDFLQDIGRSLTDNLLGGYGKSLSANQYFQPYAFTSITEKPDGTGYIIAGLEQSGVVAQATENGHDDIYGTKGSDNIVGRAGKNSLFGYEGNDHLEGRSNDDVIIAGQGHDYAFGGAGDDYISGEEGNDHLEGGTGNDAILGGEGDDLILGGEGSDQIQGDAGADYIEGGTGDDTILAGTGNDVIHGGEGSDAILGEDGDDIIRGGSGNDTIQGDAGADIIHGEDGSDNIKGGAGDDEIYSGSSSDIVYGDAGTDIINSGQGDDLAFGGTGNDIIYGESGNDTLRGEFGNDYLLGGQGDDQLDGFDGDDVLFGGEGSDALQGGRGNDTYIFRQGDGADTITEIEGDNDTIRLENITSALNDGSARLLLQKSENDLTITIKYDNIENTNDWITIKDHFIDADSNNTTHRVGRIEFADGKKIELKDLIVDATSNITYNLSDYTNIDTAIQSELAQGYQDLLSLKNQDFINPDSDFYANNYQNTADQDADNELYNKTQWRAVKKKRSAFGGHYIVWEKYYEKNLNGGAENDRIVGHWWGEKIQGNDGDDQLYGGDGDDMAFGGNGDDLIYGGAGNDKLYGHGGNDRIFGGEGNDIIDGGAQNDDIDGGAGDDQINAGGGDDKIRAGAGSDTIIAGSGNDIVNAGTQKDNIDGGESHDLLEGSSDNDTIKAGAGNDAVYGQDGDDRITAGEGDDYVSGGSGDDVIDGGQGNDTIFGDLGADIIDSGAGNDYVFGGAGADNVILGEGDDTARLGAGDDYALGGSGNDIIHGGEGSDEIHGNQGNDTIHGDSGGDVLYGQDGNDTINGGAGNDIIIGGMGSDTINGGLGNDILIISKEDGQSDSIDVIEGFDKNQDRIIIKANYKNPINFTTLQSLMTQNGDDIDINFANGQKIIIKNAEKADLTTENLAVGLSLQNDGEILFGDDGDNVLFGDEDDNVIYGGAGNDEIWGGKGKDALYGQDGDDILRYEADGKYQGIESLRLFDEDAYYWGYSHRYHHHKHYFSDYKWSHILSGSVGDNIKNPNIKDNDDVFFTDGTAISKELIEKYRIANEDSKSKDMPLPHWWHYGLNYVDKLEYEFKIQANYGTKNFHNNEITKINGYNKTADIFDGGDGRDVILMTEGDDVLALNAENGPRVKDVAVIYAGQGDDVVNFSSPKHSHPDISIYAGQGNDKIWLNQGNDDVFGQEGDDEVYSGGGDDVISGGVGNDFIDAGSGNDVIDGGSGDDIIKSAEGDDLIFLSNGTDAIDGGQDNDTLSFINSASSINLTSGQEINSIIANSQDIVNSTITNVEKIIGSNYDDNINVQGALEINAGAGDDIITTSNDNNIFIYNLGDGFDSISDFGGRDVVKFGSNISLEDLLLSRNGNDLLIGVNSYEEGSVTIKNHFTNSGIEYFEFDNGQKMAAGDLTILSQEQEASQGYEYQEGMPQFLTTLMIRENPDEMTSKIAIEAEYGKIEIIDPQGNITNYISRSQNESHTIKYYKNKNINASFDKISYFKLDSSGQKHFLYDRYIYEPVDNVISSSLQDFSIDTGQKIEIDLNDYFTDFENKLTYTTTLPTWLTYNEKTATISGTPPKTGDYILTITAKDNDGATITQKITVNVAKDLKSLEASDVSNHLAADKFDSYKKLKYSAKEGQDFSEKLHADPLENNIINAKGGNDNVIGSNQIDIIDGGHGDDVIEGQDGQDLLFGKKGNDKIQGDAGNDMIWGAEGDDYLQGGAGDDMISTGSGQNTAKGGSGDDRIYAGNDNDIIYGDAGQDCIRAKSGDDKIDGGSGNDKIYAESGNDVVSAGQGDDYVNGGTGDDQILGQDGQDYLKGDAGNDKIWGENGNDHLEGGTGDDMLSLGSGNDKAFGQGGNDRIYGGSGNDNIQGNQGQDYLKGGSDHDKIHGGTQNDRLYGEDGNDTLTGGLGADYLRGGQGEDIFRYESLLDSTKTPGNTDYIADFTQGQDKIDLSLFEFNQITKASNDNTEKSTLTYHHQGNSTIIEDQNSDFTIKLQGKIDLGAEDFMF